MNFAYKLLLPGLIFTLMAGASHAQEPPGEDEEKRVQYQLVRPDEKTPENVKPEEHNPFESENEVLNRQAPGDTEENRVRDKLLKLPVVGATRMADGRMRVLLGDIILETGGIVPPVLPDQRVELKVKNITDQYIELAWQEKRVSGLPPQLMMIPINIKPQVRYQMLGQTGDDVKNGRGTTNAKMELPLRNLAATQQNAPTATQIVAPANTAEPVPPRAQLVADDPQPFTPPRVVNAPQAPAHVPMQAATAPPTPQGPPPATTPTSPAVESVVRMLFGNPTPAPK